MARKPEVNFFTTGSLHAFPLFLHFIENTVTLNFRMYNFFLYFSVQDESRKGASNGLWTPFVFTLC